ncbi:hypothetical protein NpPPO83_00009740 [Neofusicoccum parvum]|uniref:Uncharacterized protein n=1 Tax=Neofusicoccum parvum TaxID=310453 RepID=A0ACB5S522_9PEZI|nr:hypothetical protein NpPPO83_00009740 [Neofusicoccum parvum]
MGKNAAIGLMKQGHDLRFSQVGHHTGNDDDKDAKLEGNSRRNSSQETTDDSASLLYFIRENEKINKATEEVMVKELQTKVSFWKQLATKRKEVIIKTRQVCDKLEYECRDLKQENAELKKVHAELEHMNKENGGIKWFRKENESLRKSVADLNTDIRNLDKRNYELQENMENDIVKFHTICTELSELIMMYEPAWLKGSSMAGQWEAFIKRNEKILKKVKDNILAECYEGCPWEDVVRRAMEH